MTTLRQLVFKLKWEDHDYREACLILLAKEIYTEKVIIFFKTKKTCHRLAALFGLFGLPACELHGNLSQTQRVTAFQDFKAGKYQYLLATDLAARGLDIKDIKTVINFELPIGMKFFMYFKLILFFFFDIVKFIFPVFKFYFIFKFFFKEFFIIFLMELNSFHFS